MDKKQLETRYSVVYWKLQDLYDCFANNGEVASVYDKGVKFGPCNYYEAFMELEDKMKRVYEMGLDELEDGTIEVRDTETQEKVTPSYKISVCVDGEKRRRHIVCSLPSERKAEAQIYATLEDMVDHDYTFHHGESTIFNIVDYKNHNVETNLNAKDASNYLHHAKEVEGQKVKRVDEVWTYAKDSNYIQTFEIYLEVKNNEETK